MVSNVPQVALEDISKNSLFMESAAHFRATMSTTHYRLYV